MCFRAFLCDNPKLPGRFQARISVDYDEATFDIHCLSNLGLDARIVEQAGSAFFASSFWVFYVDELPERSFEIEVVFVRNGAFLPSAT